MRASKPSSARCHTTSRVPTLDCLVVGGNLERVHEEDSLDVYRDSVSLTESMMSSGDNAHKNPSFLTLYACRAIRLYFREKACT